MTPYRADIVKAASLHGLDPDLVAAVVEQESAGAFWAYRYEPAFFTSYLAKNAEYKDRDPHEVSASFGLMQPLFVTAQEHGFTGEPWDLFNPTINLDVGCRILASLYAWARTAPYQGLSTEKEKRMRECVLAAYNGGRGGNSPRDVPLRNQAYADSVITRWLRIRKGQS